MGESYQIHISPKELSNINLCLSKLTADTKAICTFLLDKSGQVITVQGDTESLDIRALGALLVGNLASNREVARHLKEKEFISILQQATSKNVFIHLTEMQWVLVVIFDETTHMGLIRALTRKAIDEISPNLEYVTSRVLSSKANWPFPKLFGDEDDGMAGVLAII